MYSESEYKALNAFSTPEIQRVPLDSIVLQMVSMGLPDVRKFPFLEPPPIESLEESVMVLKAQNALNDDESLTVIGQMLANLPVDVVIGKMLIMGTLFDQSDAILSLAAALSVQNPFTNNAYQDQDCIASRRNLDSDHGDPITLLNSYREWLEIKAINRENSKKWCRKRGLEEQRFYEMTKLRQQFKDLLEDAGLLKKDMKKMSSSDRIKRHGELKNLRHLKKEFHKQEGPKKKKILKMTMFETMEETEDDKLDIKDIEFRMRNDTSKVLQSSKSINYKDLTILKLILTSGLYPQIALGDEYNPSKSGSEQMFHTRVKPFNVLHPNGIFASYPEYLNIDNMDVINVPGFPGKYPVSTKHQVLIYLSLLETNKPYLINTIRMPALPTLLLFSKTIDSNLTFSRLVFDSWIEIRFPKEEEGQKALMKAIKLRSLWQEMLTVKLTEDDQNVETLLETKLASGLLDFIHTEALFSIRRLLPGDLKIAFCGPGNGHDIEILDNPFGQPGVLKPNESKGGFCLNDFLTYNCLINTAEEFNANLVKYECDMCEETFYTSQFQRVCHFAECHAKKEAHEDEVEETERKKHDPNAQEYFCSECDKTLYLTNTEILRHKRSH